MVGYKNALIVVIAVCLSMIPISVQSRAVVQEPVSIGPAMISLGCTVEYLDVNGWCVLKGNSKSMFELKLLAKKAAEFFSLRQDYDIFASQGQGITQVNITGVNDRKQVVSIICQSEDVSNDEHDHLGSYIVVNIVDHSQNADGTLIKTQVENFLQEVGIKPTVTMTYVGSFEGRLDSGEMQSFCDAMLERLKGRAVEGIQDEGLISVSGYSPLLGKGIVSGGRSVNLQVAMRYNSYKDRTYIWVGTPIINIEY